MGNVWFTSDTHFSHSLISRMRNFENIKVMNEVLIKNWNRNIKPKDTVYFLGDFCFDNRESYNILDRLNGNIHLVLGNHDLKFYNQLKNKMHSSIKSINRILDIKIDDIKISLCHFQMYQWNCSHYGAFHLYGHNHKFDRDDFGKCLNVGMDLHNLEPISWEFIKEEIDTRPDNHDYLKRWE